MQQNNLFNIIQSDFSCIGNVATHCDLPKLCIAINEAIQFDLSELFCSFWFDVESIYKEVNEYLICKEKPECDIPEPENYELKYSLIYGGNYKGCNEKKRSHLGLKSIAIYYAYSRYLQINGFNDTPNGNVQKTNDFSIPKDYREVKAYQDKYRSMGYDLYKKTLDFLCTNREVFQFESKECKYCGCGPSCDSSTKAKGYGFNSSIISR